MSAQSNEALAGYPVVVEIPVAWGDMDAMGHVNNTVYFRYFETVRIAAFGQLGLGDIAASNGVGPILHSASCRFRIPLTFPDTVLVGAAVDEIGEDRFVMRYRAVSQQHQAVAAEGESMIVTFDYANGVKAPISAALRAQLVALQGQLRE